MTTNIHYVRSAVEIGVSPAFESNQSNTIVQKVLSLISREGVRSVLDLGAGLPTTALPISQAVSRYVAVENDSARAALLRGVGLSVIETTFPSPIGETFDLVLTSHSIPEPLAFEMEPFLDGAWSCVASKGTLAIITFIGCERVLNRLRTQVAGDLTDEDGRSKLLLKALCRFASVNCEFVTSSVRSTCLDDMVSYLERTIFRDCASFAQYEKDLRRIISSDCLNVGDGYYTLETPHNVISCRKLSD